jgi:drug/metabolite transporter (DMT)-like permease
MSNATKGRERAIWIGVVAVLATSLLWLATFVAIALASTHAVPLPGAIVVIRSLARVIVVLVSRAWPMLPLLMLGGIMLGFTLRGNSAAKREARHA